MQRFDTQPLPGMLGDPPLCAFRHMYTSSGVHSSSSARASDKAREGASCGSLTKAAAGIQKFSCLRRHRATNRLGANTEVASMPVPKCARCDAMIRDGDLVVFGDGDSVHLRCWHVASSSERVQIAHRLAATSREHVARNKEHIERVRETLERTGDLVCVVCDAHVTASDLTDGVAHRRCTLPMSSEHHRAPLRGAATREASTIRGKAQPIAAAPGPLCPVCFRIVRSGDHVVFIHGELLHVACATSPEDLTTLVTGFLRRHSAATYCKVCIATSCGIPHADVVKVTTQLQITPDFRVSLGELCGGCNRRRVTIGVTPRHETPPPMIRQGTIPSMRRHRDVP